MTIPRQLTAHADLCFNGDLHLFQSSLPEIQSVRSKHFKLPTPAEFANNLSFPWFLGFAMPATYEFQTTIDILRPIHFVFRIRATNETFSRWPHRMIGRNWETPQLIAEYTTIGIHISSLQECDDRNRIYFDRTLSGNNSFAPGFAEERSAFLPIIKSNFTSNQFDANVSDETTSHLVKLHVFVDRSSVEVFYGSGESDEQKGYYGSLSNSIFPSFDIDNFDLRMEFYDVDPYSPPAIPSIRILKFDIWTADLSTH